MPGSSPLRRPSSRLTWIRGSVALALVATGCIVAAGPASQASSPAEASAAQAAPRVGSASDTLGSWTPMGIKVRTGDDSFQDPGLNQAVYALAKYDGDIYAGGLFDDTGGGGNNEADCSDDANYPLSCIAKWDPSSNAWTGVGGGLNEQVDAFVVMDDTLYVGGEFDDTVGGPGFGRCNPSAGIAWTPRVAASDDSWSSVTWGGAPDNRFVAVASAGDDTRVMTSTDGVNWTSNTPAPRSPWSSVTWGNGMFVAVASAGDDTRVMTSTDGVTWSRPPTAVRANAWQSVTWGGAPDNHFVAVAPNSDDSQVMTSPDGITWTPQRAASDDSWTSVTWGNGLFVAVASNGDDTPVMTSPDGVHWTRPSTRVPVNEWQSVTWGNNLFVAVSSNGDDTQVMTSENGSNWSSRAGSFYEDSWKSVTWAGDMFVAVASSGTGRQVMYSRDGVTWSTRTSGTVPNQWQSVARGDAGEPDNPADDTIVVVGASGDDSQVMTSVATPSPGDLRCIAAWNGTALTWSPLDTGVNGGTTALAALGDDTLVVAGGFSVAGTVGAPPDGELAGLAAWSDNTWSRPGMGGTDTQVFSLLSVGDDTAYMGGEYNADEDDSGVTLMSGPFVDPESWFPMSTGFSWIKTPGSTVIPGRVDALALLDDRVYAGGYFTATGDRSRPLANLAAWNGSSWNTVGDGLNTDDSQSARSTSVRALASDDTRGLLYVGGTFDDTAGGSGNGLCDDTNIAVGPLRCVTVWDKGINEFIPFKWGSGDDSNGLTGEVKALVVDDSVVYVGGQFNTWPEGGFPKAWNLKNVGKWTWGAPSAALSTSSGTAGTSVSISGSRLIGVSEVKFGTTPASFTRSSITSMAATVPNLAPGTYTVTVNAVGGIANAGTYTVSSTNPPTPSPPSPPQSVTAMAGDASATVSWQPPASPGSYPVTSYEVTSSPSGGTCLVAVTRCEITDLTNGTSYTFTVRALSGAGWSVASAPSNAVTPSAEPPPPTTSITITGTRGSTKATVTGTTTGFGMGGMVTAHTRTARGTSYVEGATALVSMDGTFDWSRGVAKRKTLWVYFTGGGVKSNVLRLSP